jgi:hypothetical protein
MLHRAPVEYLGLQVCLVMNSLLMLLLSVLIAKQSNPYTFSILIPNQCFLFQLQLIEDDFETFQEKDLEFFFSRDKAILGWNGLPHPNPKVCIITSWSFHCV